MMIRKERLTIVDCVAKKEELNKELRGELNRKSMQRADEARAFWNDLFTTMRTEA